MEYYSAIKKNEIMPFAATGMELLCYIKSERKPKMPYDSTYIQNLKSDTDELVYETETDSQTQRTNLHLPKGKR